MTATPLLFKFFSVRDLSGVGTVDDIQRTIKVSISSRDGFPICQMEVLIKPKVTHVDHLFKLYEPARSSRQIMIPNFGPTKLLPPHIRVLSSSPNIAPTINKQEDALHLDVTTKDQGSLINA